jgi:signal transduction histidine kinase
MYKDEEQGMGETATVMLPSAPDLRRFQRWILFRLRWASIAVLLLITLLMPTSSHVPFPIWMLVLAFALYNLLNDLLRSRLSERFSLAWLALLDLPIAGLLYFLGAETGGPLFLIFVLGIDTAAASMTLRGTLLYSAAAALIVSILALMLPLWSGTPTDIRMLATQLSFLVLVGAGMAIVMRRLVLEQTLAHVSRDEAERFEALHQLQADFIATVSHDLRTPLAALQAGLDVLHRSAADRLRQDEQRLFENGRRNTERLRVLIDDLLAFNQLEAGTFELDREPLDLRTVIHAAVSAVSPLLQEKEQTVALDLPEPLLVEGDQQRLEQVLVNLLANANRHTQTGAHIAIEGRVMAHSVLLTLRDNGPGIPLEQLDKVFQRFYRVSRTSGGSGLGLAIAKAVVELHGGRMWAESQRGAGAVFHIALPSITDREER